MDVLKRIIEQRNKEAARNADTKERIAKTWDKELFHGRDDIKDLIKGILRRP